VIKASLNEMSFEGSGKSKKDAKLNASKALLVHLHKVCEINCLYQNVKVYFYTLLISETYFSGGIRSYDWGNDEHSARQQGGRRGPLACRQVNFHTNLSTFGLQFWFLFFCQLEFKEASNLVFDLQDRTIGYSQISGSLWYNDLF
jgi:hypothetical protein